MQTPEAPEPRIDRLVDDEIRDFYQDHYEAVRVLTREAFGHSVSAADDKLDDGIARRVELATSARVIHVGQALAGLTLSRIIDATPEIKGRAVFSLMAAVSPKHQTKGLLAKTIAVSRNTQPDVVGLVAATRNPKVITSMAHNFQVMSPDLSDESDDPLHHYHNDERVRFLTKRFAQELAVESDNLPYADFGEYAGLYMGRDPGKSVEQLPRIADNPTAGIITVGLDGRT